jgi:hypothetical protein
VAAFAIAIEFATAESTVARLLASTAVFGAIAVIGFTVATVTTSAARTAKTTARYFPFSEILCS